MLGDSESLRLLKAINGLYQPSRDGTHKLAERARLNKLYLAYLRRVGGVLGDELELEESRFKWFMQDTLEVVKALKGGTTPSTSSGGLWTTSQYTSTS